MSRTAENLNPLPYDGLPGYKVGGTSKEAALAVAESASEIRQRIIDALPGTSQQIAAKLGRKRSFIGPRLSELVAEGKARKSARRELNEDTGLTASVYELC